MNYLFSALATIGLLFTIYHVFRSGWKALAKTIVIVVLVLIILSVWRHAMLAPIVMAFGAYGIVVLGIEASKRWNGHWWQGALIVVVCAALIGYLLYPLLDASPSTLLPPHSSAPGTAPSSVDQDPDPAPAPVPRSAPSRPNCDEIPYEYKAAAGCPQ